MTDKVYTINELRGILTPLFSKYEIDKAYLFGSYARGEARKESDVDIALELSRDDNCYTKILSILGEAPDALSKRVDCFGMFELRDNSSIRNEILKDRVKIYDKSQ